MCVVFAYVLLTFYPLDTAETKPPVPVLIAEQRAGVIDNRESTVMLLRPIDETPVKRQVLVRVNLHSRAAQQSHNLTLEVAESGERGSVVRLTRTPHYPRAEGRATLIEGRTYSFRLLGRNRNCVTALGETRLSFHRLPDRLTFFSFPSP
jgi:hypothetical protein